jgi:Mn2+/Fe2+ NRAMP family transporter
MGEFVNGRVYNAVVWTTTVLLILLTLVMIATAVFG